MSEKAAYFNDRLDRHPDPPNAEKGLEEPGLLPPPPQILRPPPADSE